MYGCNKDVRAYHASEVTLPQPERTNMRDRRDSNRDRLKARITIQPKEFIKQGSYAMKTMAQDPDNDYDIDDGVYFSIEALKDENGIDMMPAAARQMVCDALADERFDKQPAVKKNCVRVFYAAGYHVDMPVYRIVNDDYELASGDQWVHSRAADVEEWFDDVNMTISPDEDDGRQFRRIVRMLKKFSRSRKAWKDSVASGFAITKLAAECCVADAEREDNALRATMKAIYARLCSNLEVTHPVTPGAMLTSGPNDSTTAFLRDKLKDALSTLEVLDEEDCTQAKAAKAWDSVFNTTFFTDRVGKTSKSEAALVLANLLSDRQNPDTVSKRGGGRFA